MHDLIRDPVQWQVWNIVLIKHCFNNCKRKQYDSSSVDQDSRSRDQKVRQRARLSLKRLTLGLNLQTLHIVEPNILFLYTRMGFPVYVGSTDCVHFFWN